MLSCTIPYDHSIMFFFFFNDTATTEIYTLSLHDALPISTGTTGRCRMSASPTACGRRQRSSSTLTTSRRRSEEHTSELQSQSNLVCRLLLEKKNKNIRCVTTRNYHSRS